MESWHGWLRVCQIFQTGWWSCHAYMPTVTRALSKYLLYRVAKRCMCSTLFPPQDPQNVQLLFWISMFPILRETNLLNNLVVGTKSDGLRGDDKTLKEIILWGYTLLLYSIFWLLTWRKFHFSWIVDLCGRIFVKANVSCEMTILWCYGMSYKNYLLIVWFWKAFFSRVPKRLTIFKDCVHQSAMNKDNESSWKQLRETIAQSKKDNREDQVICEEFCKWPIFTHLCTIVNLKLYLTIIQIFCCY